MVMQEVVCALNPTAAEASDAEPKTQVPHITSAYLLLVGTELGFRGVAAARVDANAPPAPPAGAPARDAEVEKVGGAIRTAFKPAEVVEALIADVNQVALPNERTMFLNDSLVSTVLTYSNDSAIGRR